MNKKNLYLVLALILIDWLDFSLYLYLAKPIITPTFFGDHAGGLILSFALFSASYLARPIGGYLLGRKADHDGRRGPMIQSALLMGVATLGICFVPSYAQAGVYATLGLLVLRIAQGVALGGEIHTSAMYLIEHRPAQKLLTGSYVAMASALGMFVGALLATLVQIEALHLSWRALFAAVGLLSLGVCYLRKSLTESPEYQNRPKLSLPLWPTFKNQMMTIFYISLFVSCMVYICNVFWVAYAMSVSLMDGWLCAWVGSMAQLFSALLAYPIAKRAPLNKAPNLLNASIWIMFIAAPFQFYFTSHHALILTLVSLGFYVLANALLCSSLYTILYQQLPVTYRCKWLSTLWAVGASIGAMSLPLLQYFIQQGYIMAPGLLMSMVALSVGIFYRRRNISEKMYREEDSNVFLMS